MFWSHFSLLNPLLFLFLFLGSTPLQAKLEAYWLGTAGIYITDGKDALLIDPFATRPGLKEILFSKELKSDQKKVAESFSKLPKAKIHGIFIGHSHYDHLMDAKEFSILSKAPIYGSPSTLNALKDFESKNLIKSYDVINFKNFEVHVLPNSHPPHLRFPFNIEILSGEILNPKFPLSVWDYEKGEVFSFLILHEPTNTKILHHGSIGDEIPHTEFSKSKADIIFVSIAQRKSDEFVIENIIKPLKAKTVVPLHFDNFFLEQKETPSALPFMGLDEFKNSVEKADTSIKVLIPEYYQPIVIKN